MATTSINKTSKVCLIYGNSGTYKSTQLGFAAEWIYKTYGKISRLISAEPWGTLQPYIDAGYIEAVNLATVGWIGADSKPQGSPLALLRKLSRGMWPTVVNGKPTMVESSPEIWERVGAYMLEGLTSSSEKLMNELRQRQQKIGQDAVTPFDLEGEKFSNNSMGHFGFVQAEMENVVKALGGLPVERVFITAHECQAEDSDTKAPIRGPGLVGKAKTAAVPSWVGECLHAESYPIEKKYTDKETKKEIATLETQVRIFFTSHPDPKFSNITYPAKPRVPAIMLGKLREKYPGGYFIPTPDGGLDEYLQVDLDLNTRAAEELQKRKDRIDNQARAEAAGSGAPSPTGNGAGMK
jgi:hypothetical protein